MYADGEGGRRQMRSDQSGNEGLEMIVWQPTTRSTQFSSLVVGERAGASPERTRKLLNPGDHIIHLDFGTFVANQTREEAGVL